MIRTICITWVLMLGCLWICPISPVHSWFRNESSTLDRCFTSNRTAVVKDAFYDVYTNITTNSCVAFLNTNSSFNKSLGDIWPQWEKDNLYMSKHHLNLNFSLYVLWGKNCSQIFTNAECNYNLNDTGPCKARCIGKDQCTNSRYDEALCNKTGEAQVNDRYIINVTNSVPNCLSCNNPSKKPEMSVKMNVSVNVAGGHIDAADAVKVMDNMDNLLATLNASSAAISVGEGISGVLVAHKNPVDIEEVSFGYGSPNGSIDIVNSEGNLAPFSRSVSVSKEAFEKALSLNVKIPFAALMRFNQMQSDALNSTVLGNEVLALEMGANITNLTNPINITFRNMKYNWVPSCHSWNGQGNQPNWTTEGCTTITDGSTITCQCSHLTFFAILMTPSAPISATDLNNLTIITQVGCGLSILFLSIVLFMHFLMRKTKANKSTKMLINLVAAMLLLNLTFIINNSVAQLNNTVSCVIIAALMHYFMLATFTWFAAQAFHLCLQLYTGGKIEIRRYILKVSVTSWALPCVIGTALLISNKYGANTEAMCWIPDSNVQYYVNIGYYAVVFFFTFTTFIIIVSWLICLKKQKHGAKAKRKGKSIMSIMGLCCMLGLTWGFAFFAYGVLRVPAYYIFTVLNSFQGFFLFIYYYKTREKPQENSNSSNTKSSTCSTSTIQTGFDVLVNPYTNCEVKK